MRFPPVDLGTGPWSKRTVASQIENFGPMSGAHRPRGSKGEVSLDNADAVIDGATYFSAKIETLCGGKINVSRCPARSAFASPKIAEALEGAPAGVFSKDTLTVFELAPSLKAITNFSSRDSRRKM